MNVIAMIGGGAVLLFGALLVATHFPEDVAEFLRRLSAPTTKTIKKQSEQMLVEMDRNVAERKARLGR
jgi:hypothetical protein